MKTDLKAKYIQHLINKKKGEEGFTLIELLVVIIIIGILSAIALPSFLNQANKAKQSEAKQYVGAMNRSQQAYYLEEGEFTTNLDETGAGIASQTTNYTYTIDGTIDGANATVTNLGTSTDAALRSYAGVTWLDIITTTSEATTLAVVCEEDTPTAAAPGTAAAGSQTGTSGDCTAVGTYDKIN